MWFDKNANVFRNYDVLTGGNGNDLYLYTPKENGATIVNTASADGAIDTVFFDEDYDEISVKPMEYNDSNIDLLGSVALYDSNDYGPLIVQSFVRDEDHQNVVFESKYGYKFTINPDNLEKELIAN